MTLTAGEALTAATARLTAAGVDSPRLDARLLLAEILNMAPQRLSAFPEAPLNDGQTARFEAMIARRERREPVSRILGRRGFWTLDLALSPATLDPRPDSETVIEAVLAHRPDKTQALRLLDFGTGSGCLLLALLAEYPAATGIGIDKSLAALTTARANAKGRALFVASDWDEGVSARFDVIVSNPPYIPEAEIDGLEPEVTHFDPRAALSGGTDGLDAYRRLAPATARLLAENGVAVFEFGQGQADAVSALFTAAGLTVREVRRDLGGIDRCVVVSLGR